MIILGFAAIDFFLWIVPSIIALIFTAIYTYANIRKDIEWRSYSDCVTLGTVFKAVAWTACSVTPFLGIIAALFFIIHTLFEYDYEIERFFRQPICFWRKRK